MRLPRTREAWALPVGLALGVVGFWGGTVVVNALVPNEVDATKRWLLWSATMISIGLLLRRFGAWYSRPGGN
jgi:hypothetical protein